VKAHRQRQYLREGRRLPAPPCVLAHSKGSCRSGTRHGTRRERPPCPRAWTPDALHLLLPQLRDSFLQLAVPLLAPRTLRRWRHG
jgi:hypothetical protein